MARLPTYDAISLFLKDGVRSFGTGISEIIFLIVTRFILVPFWSRFFFYNVIFCR